MRAVRFFAMARKAADHRRTAQRKRIDVSDKSATFWNAAVLRRY